MFTFAAVPRPLMGSSNQFKIEDLTDLFQGFESSLDKVFETPAPLASSDTSEFAADIYKDEEGKNLFLSIPLPGLGAEDVDVNVLSNKVLSVEIKSKGDDASKRPGIRPFKDQKFTIPDNHVVSEATMKNGLLTVTISQVESSEKVETIKIKTR